MTRSNGCVEPAVANNTASKALRVNRLDLPCRPRFMRAMVSGTGASEQFLDLGLLPGGGLTLQGCLQFDASRVLISETDHRQCEMIAPGRIGRLLFGVLAEHGDGFGVQLLLQVNPSQGVIDRRIVRSAGDGALCEPESALEISTGFDQCEGDIIERRYLVG